ncbi:MAG: gliding motility lipoprotein GldD [Marinirhabdus sp.]
MRHISLLFVSVLLLCCQEHPTVKPAAALRLEYPAPEFERVGTPCPFTFEKNTRATLTQRPGCALNLHYPELNAAVFITYRRVNGNMDSILYDAQKLTADHHQRAEAIFEQPMANPIAKVYGMFYGITGNAATNTQFYVTDSTSHFLSGSVYFNARPNYDSLYPAINYMRNDVRRLMESFRFVSSVPSF